jgi:hypothetical protein
VQCNSNRVGFIFDDNFKEIFFVKELIYNKKVILSNSIHDYYRNTGGPKWMCYDCHDCGVVLF